MRGWRGGIARYIPAILVLLVCLIVTPSAHAHEPVFGGDYPQTPAPTGKPLSALRVDDVAASHVFYNELKGRDAAQAYAITAAKGAVVNAQIVIPVLPSTKSFRPVLALVGAGLPQPSKADAASLPFVLPGGAGLVLSEADPATGSVNPATNRYVESFMGVSYWKGQAIVNDLPQSGTYYLVVFARGGTTGKYALSLGSTEIFGLREFALYPAWWVQVKLWAEDYVVVIIAAVVVLMLIALLVWLWRWSGAPARARKRAADNAAADGGSAL